MSNELKHEDFLHTHAPDKFLDALDLSILIVSYNTCSLTAACIQSIFDSKMAINFEIIVFDNASTDNSPDFLAENFPNIKLIASDKNIGFGAANNIASEHARGHMILLLNPDTLVIENGLQKLYNFACVNGPDSIYGGASYNADQEIDTLSCVGEPTLWSLAMRAFGFSVLGRKTRLFNSEEIPGWHRDSIKTVPVIKGCFLLISRASWDVLEGFDNDYFLYSEETDLCKRAGLNGIECIFYPYAKIHHVGAASESSKPSRTIKLLNGKAIYYSKHWGRGSLTIASILTDFFVLFRRCAYASLSIVSKRYESAAQHWSIVWKNRPLWSVAPGRPQRRLAYSLQPGDGAITSCTVTDTFQSTPIVSA